MARRIDPSDWRPVGVSELEPLAEQVVRSTVNHLVVAGPGAGKTELLAQRASFLLDTWECRRPLRILAISFKRDASKNLEARVEKRCEVHSDRFDSFTLDSFAKQIVDRFLPSLAAEWAPNPRYQVRLASLSHDAMVDWLDRTPRPPGCPPIDVRSWERTRVKRVFDAVTHGEPLPLDASDTHAVLRHWGTIWWRSQLDALPGQPSITFPMLNRLAAFLLRENPHVLRALRTTYSHVFLDEFQDTTDAQWDLVRTAFRDSASIVTAVGDAKQRIMVWAGAKTDVFETFMGDFGVLSPTALTRNYRSVPDLVQIQHSIALDLDSTSAKPVAASRLTDAGICRVLEFKNPDEPCVSS
jgi:superfamily I DNA/RNA helicase